MEITNLYNLGPETKHNPGVYNQVCNCCGSSFFPQYNEASILMNKGITVWVGDRTSDTEPSLSLFDSVSIDGEILNIMYRTPSE